MNIERIDDAIRIMQEAQNLDMRLFQNGEENLSYSIDELHDCGNTACFAGYIALSPMFQEAGGHIGVVGGPSFEGEFGTGAISEYLGISMYTARNLIHGHRGADAPEFYPVPFKNVKPHHVIDKLEMIKRGELV